MKLPTKDHKGEEFDSIAQMCNKWGIPAYTYYRRIADGMSVEDALTTPVDSIHNGSYSQVDHLGNKFRTKEAMCAHYGISSSTVSRRLEAGYSLEDALTKPLNSTIRLVSKKDIKKNILVRTTIAGEQIIRKAHIKICASNISYERNNFCKEKIFCCREDATRVVPLLLEILNQDLPKEKEILELLRSF